MAKAYATYQFTSAHGSASVAADGTATVVLGPPDLGHVWRVTRAVVAANGSALEGPANFYLGSPSPQAWADGTATGTLDVAEYPAPLVVPATIALTFVWSGLTPGAQVLASVQYEDLQEMAVPDSQQLAGRVF